MANNNHLNPHDRFFRKLMSNVNVARDFFLQNLPQEIQELMDFRKMQLAHESLIDDKLKQQITDLLYKVEFNQKPGYIYLLVEHQSSPALLMPFRILKYMVAIMDQHLNQTDANELPLIYPMIFYSGAKPYKYSTDLFDLFGKHHGLARQIWNNPYQLIDLQQESDEDFERFKLYSAMAKLMKYIHDHQDNIILLLNKVAEDLRRTRPICAMDYIYTVISYLIECCNVYDAEGFKNAIKREFSIDEENFMRNVNPWRDEGIREGRLIGIREGKVEGMREGMREGLLKGKRETASRMLTYGMPIEQISDITGLSISEIEDLQKL